MRQRASLVIGVRIGAAIVAVTALSGCAAPPAPRAAAIPESLQTFAYSGCLNQLDPKTLGDLGISIGGDGVSSSWVDVGRTVGPGPIWHVHVTAGRIVFQLDGDGAVTPSSDELGRANQVGSDLFACVSKYRFQSSSDFPHSRAALLQLYRYDVGVLWPCLSAHGVVVGPPPPRSAFLAQVTAYSAYPLPVSGGTEEVGRLLQAAAACPALPEYLRRR